MRSWVPVIPTMMNVPLLDTPTLMISAGAGCKQTPTVMFRSYFIHIIVWAKSHSAVYLQTVHSCRTTWEFIWNQFRWERFSGTEDIVWTNIPWGLVTVTLMTLRAASQNWHTIPWLMHGDAPQYQSLLQKVQKSRRYQIWIWTHLGKVHCAEDPYVAASVLLLADLEDSHQVTIGKATHHRPAKHTRPQLCHLHLSVTLTVSPSSEKKIAWILFSTSTIWALELDGFVFRNKILPDSGVRHERYKILQWSLLCSEDEKMLTSYT